MRYVLFLTCATCGFNGRYDLAEVEGVLDAERVA